MKVLSSGVATDSDLTTTKTRVLVATLTPAAAVSTAIIKNATTTLWALQAAASGDSETVYFPDGLMCGTKLTVTVTGAGAVLYVGV